MSTCFEFCRQVAGLVVSGQSTSINDTRLSCSFSRMKQVNNEQVYNIDADHKYHILMAKGPASGSGQCNI